MHDRDVPVKEQRLDNGLALPHTPDPRECWPPSQLAAAGSEAVANHLFTRLNLTIKETQCNSPIQPDGRHVTDLTFPQLQPCRRRSKRSLAACDRWSTSNGVARD